MNNNMFDEANIDLEEQMYFQDIQDEMNESIENIEEDEDDTNDYVLTKSFLDSESKLKDSNKTILTIINKKTNIKYSGIVLGKATNDKNKYVFKLGEITADGVKDKKIRILNFSDIKKA